jgi:hypothetical protein
MMKHNSFFTFYLFRLNVAFAILFVILFIGTWYSMYIVEPMSVRKKNDTDTSKTCETCPPCDNEEDDDANGGNRKKKGKGKGKKRQNEDPVDEDAIPPTDPNYKNLATIKEQRTTQNKTFLGEVSKIFKSLMLDPETSFCEHNKTNGGAMQKQCSALTHENCGSVSCCVWGIDSSERKEQCMAGGKDGAMYSTDAKGNPVTIDTYYYQNKCFGANCPLKKMQQMQQMKMMKQRQQ